MRRTPVLIVVLVALVVMAAAPAGAHPQAHPAAVAAPPTPVEHAAPLTEALSAAAPLPETPWAALAALAVFVLVVAWRPRRVLALTLALVVGILAFETGIHSTHHLARPDEAARCVVAGVLTKLSADRVDITLDLPRAPAVVEAPVAACAPPVVIARVVAPDTGRAPPALSA